MIRVVSLQIQSRAEMMPITDMSGPMADRVLTGGLVEMDLHVVLDTLIIHGAGLAGRLDLITRIETALTAAFAEHAEPTSAEVFAEIISGRKIRL